MMSILVPVQVPYCNTCDKPDYEAAKYPHFCCGDTYYSHAVKFDGTIVHGDEEMEQAAMGGHRKWASNFHEFELETIMIKAPDKVEKVVKPQ